jgi:hypothetical protein
MAAELSQDELVPVPDLPPRFRIEHSRIVGDYYRNLSANYEYFHRQQELYKQTFGEQGIADPWPTHPFPNEQYTFAKLEKEYSLARL